MFQKADGVTVNCLFLFQANEGILLGVAGVDVPVSEMNKFTPSYQVMTTFAVSTDKLTSFFLTSSSQKKLKDLIKIVKGVKLHYRVRTPHG